MIKLKRYAEKIDQEERTDFLVHDLNVSIGKLIAKLEKVRLKPKKTLDRKLMYEAREAIGEVYWHFVQLVKMGEVSFSELEMEDKPELKDRYFDEGFTHLRRAAVQAVQISEWRQSQIDDTQTEIDFTPFRELHFRMKRAVYHFGLYDLRTVLERDLQQRFDDKSLTLYD